MGLCCSMDEQAEPFHCSQYQLQPHNQQPHYGVGMGIAMMMQRSAALVTASSGMDLMNVETRIRKAKAEGRTVTIENGCLYFDYQLVGPIPSNPFSRA